MYKPALIAGTLSAIVAVIAGAFGAHVLKHILSADQYSVFSTAVRFHFYHCFALIFTGILYKSFPYKLLKQATWLFVIGTVLFCGSLLVINLLSIIGGSIGIIGIVTPIGGLCFILGWLFLLLGILKKEVA